jgi:hypothetical protein
MAFSGYSDAEAGVAVFAGNGQTCFLRHPGDPGPDRLNIKTSRAWALKIPKEVCGSMIYVTYHTITKTLSGEVTGYSGMDPG